MKAPLPYGTLEIGAHTGSNGCHIYLTDPSGRKIGVVWGKADEKAWTAHHLVMAANSHEALADLASNVAGFDDALLQSADLNVIRATLREWRDQARTAKSEVSP